MPECQPGERASAVPVTPRRITRAHCAPTDLVEAGDFTTRRRTKKNQTIVPPTHQNSDQERSKVNTAEIGKARLIPTGANQIKESIEAGQDFGDDDEGDEGDEGDEDEDEAEDYLDVFYRNVGYLPPLDDDTLDALKLFHGMDKEADKEKATGGRISPTDQQISKFEEGLECRNVEIMPDGEDDPDPQLQVLQTFKTMDYSPASGAQDPKFEPSAINSEAEGVRKYLERLWAGDLQKCRTQSQEAVFQRLTLISMIDRQNLIYRKENGRKSSLFDFAVEAQWTCPPMPTKAKKVLEAGNNDTKWLTCPLPDLAVAFCRTSLKFPKGFDWTTLPQATKRLVCYEGEVSEKNARAFHFFAIEAKRFYKDLEDRVARAQCLNNASQALHNLYEIFREADQEMGGQATKIFFDEIRFFSVVATPKGVKIRVHRARKIQDDPEESHMPIAPDYPLRFTYTDYLEITGKDYTYGRVTRELSRIVLGYGAMVLKGHLENAIDAIHRKFTAYERQHGTLIWRDEYYYSHGHVPLNTRRKTQSRSRSRVLGRGGTSDDNTTPRPRLGSLASVNLDIDGLDFGSQATAKGDGESAPPPGPADPPRAVASLQKSRNKGTKRQRVG